MRISDWSSDVCSSDLARSRSRRRALQAVYAMQVSGADAKNAIAQFAHERAHEVDDLDYFEDLVRGVEKHRRELDAALQPFLDRGIEEVDQIERAMLRISAYELQHRIDVPYRVIIDEALQAVKRLGSEHGHTDRKSTSELQSLMRISY